MNDGVAPARADLALGDRVKLGGADAGPDRRGGHLSVRATTSPASRMMAICSGDLIWISVPATRATCSQPPQRTNGRSAASARLVISSTGPVASMPIRMFSSA